jgi:hypothetical protein
LWSNWWNEDWQGKPKYSEKTCPSAILSTTNPTWPDPGANSGRRGGKPATNRLSYGAALIPHYFQHVFSVPFSVKSRITFWLGRAKCWASRVGYEEAVATWREVDARIWYTGMLNVKSEDAIVLLVRIISSRSYRVLWWGPGCGGHFISVMLNRVTKMVLWNFE